MEPARTWLPRGIAVLAFAAYAAAAPGGPHWLGAADAALAAAALGAPASGAHPAAIALAGAASLIPIGELAFRVHLASAVAAALAVLWTFRLVLEVGQGDRASLVGGAAAAFGLAAALPFTRAATVAGAGALAAAAAALALLLFVRVARGEGARTGLALALVTGIGLATHAAFAALVPVMAALVWLRLRRGARWPLAIPLLLVGAGAGALAYAPVRASSGELATLAGLAARLGSELTDPAAAGFRLAAVAEALGPGLIVAALGGAVALVLGRRERWLLVAALALAAGALFIGAPPPGNSGGGALVALAAAALAGAGVAWLARSFGRAGPHAGAVAALIAVLPPALASWDAHPVEGARPLADMALRAAPPRAVVAVRSDAAGAALRYHQAVEQARPDVDVVARGGALDGLIRDTRRPVVWEIGPPEPPRGYALHVVDAPFARLVPFRDGGGDLERAAETIAEVARREARDPVAARAYADALVQLAHLALTRGEPQLAHRLAVAALGLDPALDAARSYVQEKAR